MVFRKVCFWFLFLAVVCSACNDDVDMNGDEKTVILIPESIISDGEISTTITTYGYDDKNRLVSLNKKESYSGNNLSNELFFAVQYNEYGQVSNVVKTLKNITDGIETTNLCDTLYFDYCEQTIQVTEREYYDIITNNDNQQILEITRYMNDNTVRNTEKFDYDDKGNISGYSLHNGLASDRYSAMYDNANGIFKNVDTPQWFFVTILCENRNLLNNRTYETLSSQNGETMTLFVHYVYNEFGYPVEEIYYPEGYSITVNVPSIRINYKNGNIK